MRVPHVDDWTIDRWKLEPRLRDPDMEDPTLGVAPPLWKDLTFSLAVAAVLWLTAAIVFR